MLKHKRRAVATVAALMLWGALLSACAPDAPAPTAPATAVAPTPTSEVNREALSPDPNFDYGFVVQITSAGFHPAWLVAACCTAITWKNLTDRTVEIVFTVLQITSGPIAPGGSWAYTPRNDESIAYQTHGGSAMQGVVQINQTSE
jgi:hypothetical protein